MVKARKSKTESADVEKPRSKKKAADAATPESEQQPSMAQPEEKDEKDSRYVRFRKRISTREPDEEGAFEPTASESANLQSCLREAKANRAREPDSPTGKKNKGRRSPVSSPRPGAGRKKKDSIAADTGATAEDYLDLADQDPGKDIDSSDEAITAGGGGTGSSFQGQNSCRDSPTQDEAKPESVVTPSDLQRSDSSKSADSTARKGKGATRDVPRLESKDNAVVKTNEPKFVLPCCACGGGWDGGLLSAFSSR